MPCLHAAVARVIFFGMSIVRYDSHHAPVLCIADLHLDQDQPAAVQAFLRFLAGPARQASALYVLGDLFEAWIGDDARPPDEPVTPALRQLAATGTGVFVMHGNRDFLLGEAFARDAGVTLLPEPSLIMVDGERIALEHGDALCTDDAAYQAFRRQVRDPAWQAEFLALPIAERIDQARAARSRSGADTANKADAIMDVNATAVATRFRDLQADRLIHGHTHRPAIHELSVDGRRRQRIVLGDWFEQGSVLRIERGSYRLETLPLRH